MSGAILETLADALGTLDKIAASEIEDAGALRAFAENRADELRAALESRQLRDNIRELDRHFEEDHGDILDRWVAVRKRLLEQLEASKVRPEGPKL